ncbi:MAG: hypothetical protein PHR29_03865 [Acholeplasmataceae bacterium]|nr:hypothetical protein [Acholeplasmataceae bacterium]
MRLRLIILILVVLATAISVLMAVDNAPTLSLFNVVIGDLPLATESPPAYLVIKAFVDERHSISQVILGEISTLVAHNEPCEKPSTLGYYAVAPGCLLKMPIVGRDSFNVTANNMSDSTDLNRARELTRGVNKLPHLT